MKQNQTTLLNGRVHLTQTVDGLRASMDSVLLAAALQVNPNDAVLDMGCGTGSVGLCALIRLNDHPTVTLTGIDIQADMIDIARQNAHMNGVADRAQFVTGNIDDKSWFSAEQFDHIVMNPPYFEVGERLSSPDPTREIAFQSGELSHWMSSALHWVRHGGSLTIIHRADRLDKIMALANGKFGAIEIWPIYSKPHDAAKRAIVRMIRNRKTPLKIHPPIIMFDENGMESAQSKSILRDGKGLL